MVAKLVAVQGMTVIVDPASPVPAGAVVASIAVLAPGGIKDKAEAKLVHLDGDQITVTAITVPSAGATIPDPGPYTVAINKTALTSKEGGVEFLVQDDLSDTINATPQIPGSPPTNYPVSFRCKISVAGQTKAKAQ